MLWTKRRSGRIKHLDDARSDYGIDYARVVHSGSFRRLQGKTQILALGDDDFYRTRLTHSMEVAQVAEGVLQQFRAADEKADGLADLLPETALVSAIGLAHDLGHPPFGHGGELALNYCMRDAGGFEGNAQTLRILVHLEDYDAQHGADLTRRSLLGTLKYPILAAAASNPSIVPALSPGPTTLTVLDRPSCKPVKGHYGEEEEAVAWILDPLSNADRDRFQAIRPGGSGHGKPQHKSFDCSIMDVADDIAYGVHDLEDAIALGLIDRDRFRRRFEPAQCETLLAALRDRPLGGGGYDGFLDALFGDSGARKRAIGRLVHHFLRAVVLERDEAFQNPLLATKAVLRQEDRALLDDLQSLVVTEVIESPSVQHLEFKGQRMVVAVFEAMASEPRRLLPPLVSARFEASGGARRIICDHVASMTDGSLLKTYDRLFSPRMGSVFDRL
jgi:dGTPase